jgi:SHS2 domain-containing protein
MKDFEILPHTADLKLRAYGKTREELFRNALIGMFQSIGPQSKSCKHINDRLVCDKLPQTRTINIVSPDNTLLLIDFLSEALYLSDVYNEAYLDVTIDELNDTHVKATLHGIVVDRFDVVEIKAVTYHDIHIKQINGIWQADIVFDI